VEEGLLKVAGLGQLVQHGTAAGGDRPDDLWCCGEQFATRAL
jgi:hypothetical protein